jgi:drug/metabolite transporter (DMT)-like permease
MANIMTPKKGLISGILSGATWGLDAVLLGVVMVMTPFVENPILLLAGGIVCSALHDIFSAIWLLGIMGAQGKLKGLGKAMISRDGRFCMLAALFGGPLAMTFYTIGISVGGAALTASVTAIYPILGTALAVLILKEKTGLQTWIGLFISVIGIIVIGWSPSSGGESNLLLGILISLVAAIGWATEGVVSGYGMKDGNVDPKMALTIRYIVSSLVYLFVVAPIFVGGFADSLAGYAAIFADTGCWILLAVTAFIGMSSFFCWYTSIDNIGAGKALCLNVTYSFWSVVFSLLLSIFLPQYFSGVFTVYIAIGSVLIITGVTLATLYTPKKA